LSSPSNSETATRSSWEYQRPKLTAYQVDALFSPERYGVCEATTKAGKTVGCMAWLMEQAVTCTVPGREFWWVAPILDQARIPYRRIKRGLPQSVYVDDKTHLRLTLANGAVLAFKGGDHPDSLYGDDVHAAVIDEGTRCKEDVFTAIRSTLTATRGPLRIIGNVKGRHNWAYVLARKAEAGEPNWHYAKITALDAVAAGILNAEEIEDARRTLPDHVFRELYMAEPSDDGGNPFGLAAIAACVIDELAAGAPAVWGWDLAKSVDHNVGIALNRAGATCRLERWQAPWEITTPRMRQMTNGVQALVDSTGVGDPILEALQKNGGANFQGFKFSAPSKQQLMEGLALAIQQQKIHFPRGPITTELETFEYKFTRTGVRYSAPQGMHDDCVMALALAWHHLSGRPRPFAAAVGGSRPVIAAYDRQVANRFQPRR
jgi:terminase large subunit-like protein